MTMNPGVAQIDTPHGRLRGRRDAGVTVFLGIPHAAAPVGARRLRSPQAPAPWAGVRDATPAGPASLQTLGGNQVWINEPIAHQSDDCLFLNVWTPDTSARLPVLFWLHGGATRNGHGAASGINGATLAHRHNMVVVTINYRLGALGGLAHPDLTDPVTGHCANWGLQDKLAALEWVRGSIAAFGGDPANVTLAGQSSGGANAAMIAQHGLAGGCYRKVIVQSPPLFRPPMFVELGAAAQYTELLAGKHGVTVAGLRSIDGVVLQRAEHTLATSPELLAAMGRPRTAPVHDGKLLRDWPYDGPAAPCPVLAGWTRDEANFWFELHDADGRVISPQKAPATAAEFEKRVAGLMALHYAFADKPAVQAVVAAYQAGKDTGAAWNEFYTDLVFRAPILHFAGRQARAGQPVYAYEFAYPLPAPERGAPHASDVPFVFGTTGAAHLARKIGSGPAVNAVSKAMMQAWTEFVQGDAPGAKWPAFDPATPRIMQFGPESAATVALRSRDHLALWPAYGA